MSTPRPVDTAIARSLAGAAPQSFWLDQPDAPEPQPALAGEVTADLAVIGGGFTGLWTALLARERFPDLDVVLVEARTVGWAARTRLSLVNSKPVPFPPEPFRSGVIQATRASIARADRNEGRRDLWLRTLDRLGLGFDS